MAFQGKFDVEIEKEGEKEKVTVVMQQSNPLLTADIVADSIGESGAIRTGTFVKKAIENEIIVSPKNLIKRIEESDNPIEVLSEVYTNVNKFCSRPRKYQLLQTENEIKAKSVGDNV